MYGLIHASFEPLFYGVVIFLGILSMILKFKHGMYLAFVCEVLVFWLVFTLHGETMTGGFAATVASLLAGIFLPWILRSK